MSEKRFDQLMEKVEDFAILFMDEEGLIQEWNVGAEKLFGISRKDVIGLPAEIIFTPQDRAGGVPEKEMHTAAVKGVAEDERWHIHCNGQFFFASGLLHAIYENGRLTGFIKIVRDLTHRVELEAAVGDYKTALEVKVEEKRTADGEEARVLRMEMRRREREDYLRLRLLQRALESQEDERKRISRDIHDHLGQELTALRLGIEALKTGSQSDGKLAESITRVEEIAHRIDDTVDFLAWELRPNSIDEIGLVRAVETYLKQWSSQFDIETRASAVGLGDKRINALAELNLYRILQESLNNVAKHARASKVDVVLEKRDGEVVMIVEDNGCGFNVEEKANRSQGLGLVGMGERAALLLGVAEIESSIGHGTSVYVRVPAAFEEHPQTSSRTNV